jgi:translation initiation factor IF-3
MAYDYGLDLLCVSPKSTPPVCKILDYGKYRFQEQKKAREAKKNQHIIQIREIQLTPQIGEHDLLIKAKKAKEFLEDGNKVRVVLRYRGRQMAHIEIGQDVLNKFVSILSDVGSPEKAAELEGKFLSLTLASKIKK